MKKNAGFTLIELVIVIIVLGVLSATAIPKFLDLQSDARKGTMNGLKAALQTAVTFTYTKAVMEGLGGLASETMSSGLKVRYGYPRAIQSDLREILSFNDDDDGDSENQDDWTLTGSGSEGVTFTIIDDSSGCQLLYSQSTGEGIRPVITISGCTDE